MGLELPPVPTGAPNFSLGLNPHILSHEIWHILAAGDQPHMPTSDGDHSWDPLNLMVLLPLVPSDQRAQVFDPDPRAVKRLTEPQNADARHDTGTSPPPNALLQRLLWNF